MTADRELLKLAAMATYSISPDWQQSESWWDGFLSQWNPLTDDGDAFRLAVKLKLDLMHDDSQDNDTFVMAGNIDHVEDVNGKVNREEATRRAIVRAAAEIGRSMK